MTHTTAKCIKNAYQIFLKSDLFTLSQCYTTASTAKHRAFNYCLDLVMRYNATKYRILGYNCMMFSFGFVGEINGKPAFFYITKDYDRYIYLDEMGVV